LFVKNGEIIQLIKDDFQDHETHVIQTKHQSGIFTSMFCKLFSVAQITSKKSQFHFLFSFGISILFSQVNHFQVSESGFFTISS
jgi:hypothetical protein